MATDLFSNNVSFGGAFSADSMTFSFAGFDVGFLVQNVTWEYQQAIRRLYEVGSANVYLVSGRTQGAADVQKVFGPEVLSVEFYATYGSVCNAASNIITVTMETACDDEGGATSQTLTMSYAVIEKVGGAVQTPEMLITESMRLVYLLLELETAS